MFRLNLASIQEEPSSSPDVGGFIGQVFHHKRNVGRYRLTFNRHQRLAEVVVMFHEETKRADDFFSIDLHTKIDYDHFGEDTETLNRRLIAQVFSPSWQLPGPSRNGYAYIFEHVTTL